MGVNSEFCLSVLATASFSMLLDCELMGKRYVKIWGEAVPPVLTSLFLRAFLQGGRVTLPEGSKHSSTL